MSQRINLSLPELIEDPGVHVIPFSTKKYCFRSEVTSLLVEKGFLKEPVPLEDLHLHISQEDQEVDGRLINKVTQSFYDVNISMQKMYFDFVKYIAREKLKFDVIFQDTLTIRFHFPGNHTKDYQYEDDLYIGHHSDTMLGHPFEEINFWLPLTECQKSSALRVSSRENGVAAISRLCEDIDYDAEIYAKEGRKLFHDKILAEKDYRSLVVDHCDPIDMVYGELLMFDSRCLHGPSLNVENKTRVSIDFRFIPLQLYDDKFEKNYSGKSGKKFARGSLYYNKSAYEL